MRRFCLILCLSLLTSMFHAAVMSTETLSAQTQTVPASTPNVHGEHHCDEQAASPAIPAFKCALGAHLCCLGLTAAFVDSPVFVFTGHNALINPVVLSLTLQTRANKLFKPPKRALLA